MVSIKNLTNKELQAQITVTKNLLEIYDFNSGNYNLTKSELVIATKELQRRKLKI